MCHDNHNVVSNVVDKRSNASNDADGADKRSSAINNDGFDTLCAANIPAKDIRNLFDSNDDAANSNDLANDVNNLLNYNYLANSNNIDVVSNLANLNDVNSGDDNDDKYVVNDCGCYLADFLYWYKLIRFF